MRNTEINWNKWKDRLWLLKLHLRYTSLPAARIQGIKNFIPTGMHHLGMWAPLSMLIWLSPSHVNAWPTLFGNKSLHILWLCNLSEGITDGALNNPHAITKNKAKDNTTASDSKQSCSLGNHSVSPTNLASASWHCWFTGCSFCQLTLAGIGTSCIWQSLSPLLSSSLELPGCGQRLQGALWSSSKHLGLWLWGWLVTMCT